MILQVKGKYKEMKIAVRTRINPTENKGEEIKR